MDLISKLAIKFSCNQVGTDEFDNKYYESKKPKNNKKRRFVIYNGISEPSKIPANWHGWIHYTTNEIPDNSYKHYWQKIHLPNLTGTKFAYHPSKKDPKISHSNYQSWQPNKNEK